MVHNKKYNQLKDRYKKKYITKATLTGWVALNKKKAGRGITPEEYREITGEEVDYEIVEKELCRY